MSEEDDSVGYRNPPKHTRFKPGQSGNPAGRPKARDPRALARQEVDGMILQEARRLIPIKDGDQVTEVSMLQANLRGLFISGAKGSMKAQIAVTEMTRVAEATEQKERHAIFAGALEYKNHWRGVIDRSAALGEEPPYVVPHPDDIGICWETLEVWFNGPRCEDEKMIWDRGQLEFGKVEARLAKAIKRRSPSAEQEAQSERDRDRLIELLSLYPEEAIRRRPGFRPERFRRDLLEILEQSRRPNKPD